MPIRYSQLRKVSPLRGSANLTIYLSSQICGFADLFVNRPPLLVRIIYFEKFTQFFILDPGSCSELHTVRYPGTRRAEHWPDVEADGIRIALDLAGLAESGGEAGVHQLEAGQARQVPQQPA